MDYISVKDAANKWKLTERRVQGFCSKGKILGAKCIGKQWIIPEDAVRPCDGRTKEAKHSQNDGQYHFPFIIYTKYYASPSNLSADEQSLCRAQVMYLAGEFSESVAICRRLIENTKSDSVKMGAYCTIGYDSYLLGVHSEYVNAIREMEKLASNDLLHKEDYRLLICSLRYHAEWNSDLILGIDSSLISPEAVDYYQMMLITASVISGINESEVCVRFYSAYCQKLELEGITPSLIAVHFLLALCERKLNNQEKRKLHIEIACKTAIENGWLNYVSKYYNLDAAMTKECVASYGEETVKRFLKIVEDNIRNWKIIFKAESGAADVEISEGAETELMLLVSHGLSNRAIANMLNLSISEVNGEIERLCKKTETRSKKELAVFAANYYDNRIKD